MKRIVLTIFALLLLPQITRAEISYVSQANGNTSGSSLTFQTTIAEGENRILFVGINYPSSVSISSVTHNGDALSEISNIVITGQTQKTGLWYIVAPDVGTYDVVVTASGSATMYATATWYTGVAQVDPISDYDAQSTNGIASTLQTEVTTEVDGSWINSALRVDEDYGYCSGSTGMTNRNVNAWDSGTTETAGTKQQTITSSTQQRMAMISAVFEPYEEEVPPAETEDIPYVQQTWGDVPVQHINPMHLLVLIGIQGIIWAIAFWVLLWLFRNLTNL